MTKEEAIMAVKEVTGMSLPWNDRHYEALQMAIKALEEPERKAGRWIRMSDANGEYYCCSECGDDLPRYSTEKSTWAYPYPCMHSINKTDFCPNCGARMEGGE